MEKVIALNKSELNAIYEWLSDYADMLRETKNAHIMDISPDHETDWETEPDESHAVEAFLKKLRNI